MKLGALSILIGRFDTTVFPPTAKSLDWRHRASCCRGCTDSEVATSLSHEAAGDRELVVLRIRKADHASCRPGSRAPKQMAADSQGDGGHVRWSQNHRLPAFSSRLFITASR